MKAPKYQPLELGLIDEGRFIGQANADLMNLQQTLLEYRETHGDAAKGAKAKLVIEITLACENPKEHLYSIKATAKKTVPNRPASASMAMSAVTDGGEPALFVRELGSDASPPTQGKFCTDDGRMVQGEQAEPVAEPM
jgi:hypothetical protein